MAAADYTRDDVIDLIHSKAFSRPINLFPDGIKQVLEQYQTVDEVNYWDLAKRFLNDDEIKRAWDDGVKKFRNRP